METTEYFIPLNVPSSKNSKIWTGKFLVWSKKAKAYKKETEPIWRSLASKFNKEFGKAYLLNYNNPVKVEFKFIRNSKHKFDFVNPLQTVLDLMVEYGWIEDDNADIILPVFEPYLYDKKNPGVIIKILK